MAFSSKYTLIQLQVSSSKTLQTVALVFLSHCLCHFLVLLVLFNIGSCANQILVT